MERPVWLRINKFSYKVSIRKPSRKVVEVSVSMNMISILRSMFVTDKKIHYKILDQINK